MSNSSNSPVRTHPSSGPEDASRLEDAAKLEDAASLEDAIAALGPWFHNLHLPGGGQTAPQHALGDFPAYKWARLAPHLPPDLNGWRVLDIGCNAGFYSFELAKRGAQVTAIDSDAHYLRQAQWAARCFGLAERVTFRHMQVYDLARVAGTFDLVLFLGVFYHLRYPTLALDIVAQRVGRLLVFQTLTLPGKEVYTDTFGVDFDSRERLAEPGWPKMAFLEHGFAGDPTNWWAPNHACVEAMLRASGLRVLLAPGHELYLCEPDPEHPSAVTTWNTEELRSAIGAGQPQ
jgi:tRNA (mo5U34)-methyltransferase